MMAEMDGDGVIDFYNLAERFTLDVIGLAGFGTLRCSKMHV